MKKVFLTGATGVMGMKGMQSILHRRDSGMDLQLTVLARPSKRNRKKLRPFIERGVKVIWGDLLDEAAVECGVCEADLVLHVGGMVSPAADWEPEKTFKVNTQAMSLIVNSAKRREARGEKVKVVYIGSVAQYGNRSYPRQWGRIGDPLCPACFDMYALSKCVAEVILSESGLKEWVSLRQTGILHPGLLGKANDPIAFHVPMATGLEWVSDDDSGQLLAALCSDDIPDTFWRNYYNIGGGDSYRMSNYDFVKATLSAVGCPPPEKVFDLNWFATRNFHGMYYQDSDVLNDYLHFRSGETFDEYMARLKKGLPFYFRLSPLAPAPLLKMFMGKVGDKEILGPRRWIKERNMPRIEAAYGSLEAYEAIPDWRDFHLPPLKEPGEKLYHGYDESKPLSKLTYGEIRKAAEFRGGKLLTEGEDTQPIGDADKALDWQCSEGHKFSLTLRTVLRGGHWCPECLSQIAQNPRLPKELARKSKFLQQVIPD